MTQEAPRLRWGRYVLIAGLCIAGLLAWLQPQALKALGSIAAYQWRPHAPTYHNQTLALSGLANPVRIHFDRQGVPHIDASNELDLMRAVGYIQAKDRFFQMDVLRRVARGRLSELVGDRPFLGSSSVAFDRAMRGWGLERRAIESLKRASAIEKQRLQAFCAGVNAARQRFRFPEYGLLGVKPAPFVPSDTYVIGMLNAWSISHNWQQELVRFLLALHLGTKKASILYPHTPLIQGLSLDSKRPSQALPPAIAPVLQRMFRTPRLPRKAASRPRPRARRRPHQRKQTSLPWQRALGIATAIASMTFSGNSNAWVVGGRRSSSGKPLLANDPHLSHFLPSLLYQQHLRTPQFDVIGATMPGVPYVLMGHNKHVAWGLTAAVADVMDLVVEKPHPSRSDQVLDERKPCPLRRRKIVIQARRGQGMTRHTFLLRETCRGPLLNDMYPDLLPKAAPMVAIQWHVDRVNIGMWGRANRAKNVKALYQALHQLPTPVATCQAADKDGNIGIFWAGTVPRRAHRGTFPYPGWRRKFQWRGQVPHKDIPFGYNPPSGLFAHGNNLLVDPHKSKRVLQIDSAPPYRVNRIKQMLTARPRHDVASYGAIQRDVKLLRAALVLPAMLADLKGMTDGGQTTQAAHAALKGWDHHATSRSVGAAIFFATYRNALRIAMAEKLSPKAFKFFLSQRYTTNVTDGWFADPKHLAWDHLDTPTKEGRADVLRRAFRMAVAQLRASQGDQVAQWRWGRLHTLQIRHPFGGIPLLGGLFNLPAQRGMGALESVWKSHFNMGHPTTPFRTVAGPAYRMIVDLGDLDSSRWILDTGASGWPGTPHYGDQFAQWRQGKTVPMISNWRTIIDTRLGTWLLLPQRSR